ncbi:EVE domain-containing protein [Mongoliimonas terrestris]|uniref:EVE domain-containing protein n=1 Tax=Mongoliimonas terrestris TaxID=1709001 RepID=UPI0009496EF3|nr:EVE domain-containing protein [Mongoliimonas terrestris]
MAKWLFKSEPFKWSFEQMKAAGARGTQWDGVRNYQARNNMRAMRLGDLGFFYHSNEGLEVVGIVEVAALVHPDSTTDDPRWECVDVRAVRDMPRPVSLVAIKAEPALAQMSLVTSMRLSVQPVTEAEWAVVCRMGGLSPDEIAALDATRGVSAGVDS